MKQLLQRLDSGGTEIADVPAPALSARHLLIRTRASVVSPGTERMLVGFGRSNLIQKAWKHPEKVRQVMEKFSTDGLHPTLDAVRARLEEPLELGYCNAGVVVAVGEEVRDFRQGDRVVSNGPHSEIVKVPRTLVAHVPDRVPDAVAAFTPLAAIGLQGVRLAAPTLGETVVVYGLGVIGLLTVQILRANGCRVIGLDVDADRVTLAERFGATGLLSGDGDVTTRIQALTGGIGADAVLLTLSASSNKPLHEAAVMSRKRGRIVLVGVTGLELRRDDFYDKELSFSVSCSFGPGRYDPRYEEAGIDYPVGFVRWTEQRNFQAVLELMASGSLDVVPLVTDRIPFSDAPSVYDRLLEERTGLGIVLEYDSRALKGEPAQSIHLRVQPTRRSALSVGVLGAGAFAQRTILPALRGAGVRLHSIASSGGRSAAVAGRKFGFERAASATTDIIRSDTDVIFVLTPHSTHAELSREAMAAGKHVFVEKPLALSEEELDHVIAVQQETGRLLMVGFNRRFARDATVLRGELRRRSGPLALVITINAGSVPEDHWIQDPTVGGGRIIGEACHWIDLSRFLAGSRIEGLTVVTARDSRGKVTDDISHLGLAFADGSTASVNYLANGSRRFPKERIEAHFDGRSAVIDNWRGIRAYGWSTRKGWWKRSMDKGHVAEIEEWLKAVAGETPPPIPVDELYEVSRWAMLAAELARAGGGSTHGWGAGVGPSGRGGAVEIDRPERDSS